MYSSTQQQYQPPQHQHHQYEQPEQPQRQPSFIGLPPISPGPNFGSALGVTAADFNLDDPQQASAQAQSQPGRDSRASPGTIIAAASVAAAAAPLPPAAPIPRQIPSPQSWINGRPSPSSNANSNPTSYSHSGQHSRVGSTSSVTASASRSSPNMNNYSTQAPVTSTYRPSQDISMQQAHYVAYQHQPSQGAQPVSQIYQNGTQHATNGHQYAVNGHNAQHQPVQYRSQSQYAAGQSNPPPVKAPTGYQQQQHQQFATVPGAPAGMPSPSLASNGTFILPPGWKVEQSHLQQPLVMRHTRASPSLSSLKQQKENNYEIDKETGAPSTRSVSPPTHSPIDMRRLDQTAAGPSSMSQPPQRNGFAPPNPPFAQQEGPGIPLGRTTTNNTQGSISHTPEELRDGRRNSSNMFSSIRNRLGGNGNDGRFDPSVKSAFDGDDGVSEQSVPVDDQAAKAPSNFFGLRGNANGNGQPASEGRMSHDMIPDRSAFSPEKKRNIFGRPNVGSPFGQDQDQSQRPSTTEGMSGPPPVVGFGPGPKKRFSKLTGMLGRDRADSQPSQPQGYTAAQVPIGRPSMAGQRPFPGMQMGAEVQVAGGPYNRPRAATNESRPSMDRGGRMPTGQGFIPPPTMNATSEDDRGRKPGNLLSNIFGKRSESKTREQQLQSSPPGLGQPQGMMQQGPSPPRPGHPGQFPSFLAHSLGMPGQPLIPPQGQYAGLAQQVQQQHATQQLNVPVPQPPYAGMSGERLGAYLQGGPSPVSPITQGGTPFAAQPAGFTSIARTGPQPQEAQDSSEMRTPPGPLSPIGSVQIATAVPIRQVERSPNSHSGSNLSGPNSPADSTRGRSASVVNQIEIGGPKRPNMEAQGGRNRSASNAIPQQQQQQQQQYPVHIASLQAPGRKPFTSTSPRNSIQLGRQETSSIDTEKQQSVSQDSPSTRRVSQNLSSVSHNASQLTPSTSPAPSQEQQPVSPNIPVKISANLTGDESGMFQHLRPNEGEQNSVSPQSSVYRPSGPQAAPIPQQLPQTQQGWGPPDRVQTEHQNGAGQQPLPQQTMQTRGLQSAAGSDSGSAQYYMQGRPPRDLMMNVPPHDSKQDKEGTFAKILKTSKTFVQDFSDKSKGDKESRRDKLLGAFKKTKQSEVMSPPPTGPPPGGPAWGSFPPSNQSSQVSAPVQQRPPPQTTVSAPAIAPAQQLVTQGLQQMPSKAQQLLGQPPNAMYQAPTDQPTPPPKSRPSPERTNSQPYVNYQDERQEQGKSTPPLSPDEIGLNTDTAATQQQQQPPAQAQVQVPAGRPSISSLPPNNGPPSAPVQQQPPPVQNQPQAQPPAQIRPANANHTPMASIVNAKSRAHALKQQIVQGTQAAEPQYAPVAIPQGYSAVYGGYTAHPAPPAPVVPSYPSAPQQQQPQQLYPGMPYQPQHAQQWVHTAMWQSMPPGQIPPAGMHPQMTPGAYPQQYPPFQGTPPQMAMAMYPPPQRQYGQQQGQMQMAPQSMPPSATPPGWPQQQQQSGLPAPPENSRSMNVGPLRLSPQQTITLQPPAESTTSAQPQTEPTAPPEVTRPAPANTVASVSQAQHHFSVVPDMGTASPLQTPDTATTVTTQILSPAPIKPQSPATAPQGNFAEQQQQQQLQPQHDNTMPQRQTSAASQVSSLTTEPATTTKGSPDLPRVQIVHPVQTQPEQLASPDRPRGVTLRDEPAKVDTPITATPADFKDEDIYGATPRQSAVQVFSSQAPPPAATAEHVIVSGPAQESTTEPDSKFAGMPQAPPTASKPEYIIESPIISSAPPQQQTLFAIESAPPPPPVIIEPASASSTSPAPIVRSKSPASFMDDEPPSPTESELRSKTDDNANDGAAGAGDASEDSGKPTILNGKPVQSSQEIFEEHKRRQLIRDMEEKIAIMPDPNAAEEDMLLARKRREEEAMPQMSATSYPGQEWNPYGEGFEDYDD